MKLLKHLTRSKHSIITNRLNALYQEQDTTQFSKARLVNHGELNDGEIPEPLKYDLPYNVTTLSNGVRVASANWPGPLSTVGIMIEAGSRNETCLLYTSPSPRDS